MAATARLKILSRSNTKYLGAVSNGNASRRYFVEHEFMNWGIEVGCQYVGKGMTTRDGGADSPSKVDVYLISLKIGDKPTV